MKKRVHKQKNSTFTRLLPEVLADKIKGLGLTNISTQKAHRVVELILSHFFQENRELSDLRPYPASYWQQVLGSHYNHIITPLKDAGILTCNDSYSTELHICKAYGINPELIAGKNKKVKCRSIVQDLETCINAAYIKRMLRRLKLDKCAAKRFIKNYVSGNAIEERLRFDEDVTKIWLSFKKPKKLEMTKRKALEIAKRFKKSLIQDGDNFTIAHKAWYIKRKKKRIFYHYNQVIEKIAKKDVQAKRNSTNNRLDSNISNLPKLLLSYLSYKGEYLLNIDLKNAQFVLFTYLLEKDDKMREIKEEVLTSMFSKKHKKGALNSCSNKEQAQDVEQFTNFAKIGTLYEKIQDYLNLGTGKKGRDLAKQTMFELLFSSHKNHTTLKKKLKEYFPTVVAIIDEYKKRYGDNQFAILLQREESKLFIDNIFEALRSKKLFCLTKHDSILCVPSNEQEVYAIICKHLDNYLGKGNYQLSIESLGNANSSGINIAA